MTNNEANAVAFQNAAPAKAPTPDRLYVAKDGKPLSKAQRLRNNETKAKLRAEKTTYSVEEAIVLAVAGVRTHESACGALARALTNTFGKDWVIWTKVNMRTDNELAVYALLLSHQKACYELSLDRGLKNLNKAWSAAKQFQERLNNGGRPNEREPRALDTRQQEELRKLYRAGGKEQKMTDEERDLHMAIGELLVAYFKVDLSKLG